MTFFFSFLTATLSLILAALIYGRNSRHPAYQAMSCMSLCLAGWSVFNWISLQPLLPVDRLFWVRAVMAVTIPIPWLFLRFAVSFPIFDSEQMVIGASRRAVMQWLPVFFAWTVLLMLISFTPLMFSEYTIIGGQPHLTPGIGVLAYGLTFLAFWFGGVGLLFQTYVRSSGLARLQSAYVLVGMVVTTVVSFLTNFILVTVFQNFTLLAFGPGSVLLLIGFISYAMLRHRLLDLRWAVIRCLAYMLTITIMILLYSFLWSTVILELSRQMGEFGQQVAVVIGMVFTMISFPVVLPVVQQMSQKWFYRTVFQPDKAHLLLSQVTANTLSSKKLLMEIDQFFCTQFGVSWCGTILRNQVRAFSLGQVLEEAKQHLAVHQLIVFDETPEGALKTALYEHQVMVAVPLSLHAELLGWVCIGPKHSGGAFSSQELQFCQTVSAQIALAIQHAQSLGKAQDFAIRLKKEVAEATSELRQANTRLAELDQLKDEFVSIASHELRTPTTAIRSYLWLCLFRPAHQLPEAVFQQLHTAYLATERLLSLVKELLTVSQLEAGRIPLKRQAQKLITIVDHVTKELAVTAKEKNVMILKEILVEDTLCDIDHFKVAEVLQNLIGNAIKFSPAEAVVIIRVRGDSENLSVEVIDQGPGIAESDQKNLFQKFGVIRKSYQKNPEQGTGLGLYIAQKFAELHHGQLLVDSEEGKGSRFVLSLPRFVSGIKDSGVEYVKHNLALTR